MLQHPLNSSIVPIVIDLQSLEETATTKSESMQDKLCSSTSGESSIEDFLVTEEEEFFLKLAGDQRKITNYTTKKGIAYSSRSNILTWVSKLLNSITLTNEQKQSIFHRFSTAYDLINEKLFIEKHPIQEDNSFKKIIVSLFLIVYKLEGYIIGKITIKSLIEAFLKEMNIKESDIKRSEIRILKIFDYSCISFDNNLHNLSLALVEMIKKKYSLSIELICMIQSNLSKINKIIEFSDDAVFDICPIDKAAISIYALIMHLKKKEQNNNNEQYTYQLIYHEMALLINNLYSYLKTVLEVISIPQSDFERYSGIYSELINK